jgi:chemotaxis signal transduction protein
MSGRASPVEELRRAFDATFATEPAAPVERVDLISLRAGGRTYAVRVSDVGGVLPFGVVVPYPSDERALLGLGVVRGSPVPVYDLAAMLGEGTARSPRWMLLSAGVARVALAFDELEGYLRVPREDLAGASPTDSATAELLRRGSSPVPVVSVASIVRRLEQRLGLDLKER